MKRNHQTNTPAMTRSHAVPTTPWDEDDNKPAIPRVPGPRRPERLTTPLVRAATRYKTASGRTAQLSACLDIRDLTDAEYDSFAYAQDIMRESYDVIAAAGRLDLIGAST